MSTEKRLNILFVFSDQQRYSALGANGNDVIQTPVLDAMAAEGIVCDNMFSKRESKSYPEAGIVRIRSRGSIRMARW